MSISVFCLLCRLVGTAVSQPSTPVNLTFCSFDVTSSVMGTKSTSSAILYYSVYSIIHPHASRSKVCDSIKQPSTFIFLTADYVVTASISLQQVVLSFYRSLIDLKYLDTLTVLSHISLFCFSHRVEVVTETGGCLSSEEHAKHLSLSATLCSQLHIYYTQITLICIFSK